VVACLVCACAQARLTSRELADPNRLALGYVDALVALPRPPPESNGGVAMYLSRPLWLGGSRYMQASARATAVIGVTGTTSMVSAVGVDVGFDYGNTGLFGFRWTLGPYVGMQFVDREMKSYTGLHWDMGPTLSIGADPRSRLLLLTTLYVPISDATHLLQCDRSNRDMTECGLIAGLTIAYEGLFL
jgi:hypothetical protein